MDIETTRQRLLTEAQFWAHGDDALAESGGLSIIRVVANETDDLGYEAELGQCVIGLPVVDSVLGHAELLGHLTLQ